MTATTASKSLADEAAQVMRAITLIKLGARMQVLESEIPTLSRERLIRLYREVKGRLATQGHAAFFRGLVSDVGTEHPHLDVC
jgi:flagellar transcriptional activator FlhC